MDCVISECKRIKKENACYYSGYVKRLCDSYGYGFVNGVSAAFQKQQEENEQGWGLVLVIPKEVEEAAKDWGKQKFRSRSQDNISGEAYTRGFHNGKEFNPKKKTCRGGGDMIDYDRIISQLAEELDSCNNRYVSGTSTLVPAYYKQGDCGGD